MLLGRGTYDGPIPLQEESYNVYVCMCVCVCVCVCDIECDQGQL